MKKDTKMHGHYLLKIPVYQLNKIYQIALLISLLAAFSCKHSINQSKSFNGKWNIIRFDDLVDSTNYEVDPAENYLKLNADQSFEFLNPRTLLDSGFWDINEDTLILVFPFSNLNKLVFTIKQRTEDSTLILLNEEQNLLLHLVKEGNLNN